MRASKRTAVLLLSGLFLLASCGGESPSRKSAASGGHDGAIQSASGGGDAVGGASSGSGGCADPTSIACPIGDAVICTDPTVDPKNCGACGTVCVGGHVCDSGQCRCPSGLSECGYQCVNLRSDPTNCGGCEVICLSGAPLCNSGECSTSCDPGLTQCDSSCVDAAADAANCGDCGKACAAGDTCVQSSCVTQ